MRAVAAAQQSVRIGFVWGEMPSQFKRLVETTFTQARWREGHGHHPTSRIQSRLNPRGMAHQMGQGPGQSRVGLKFKACHAVGTRKGVAHRRHAGVQRAGMRRAVAADGGGESRNKHQCAGRATWHGLCKLLDASGAHWFTRPGMADLTHARKLAKLPQTQAEFRREQSPAVRWDCHALNILPLHV